MNKNKRTSTAPLGIRRHFNERFKFKNTNANERRDFGKDKLILTETA